MVNGRLQGKEQFRFKCYLLETLCYHTKLRLKRAPQRLNLVIAKAISTAYTQDYSCKCPCMFPHIYVQ